MARNSFKQIRQFKGAYRLHYKSQKAGKSVCSLQYNR